jgi:RNA recognition motif-containing protein
MSSILISGISADTTQDKISSLFSKYGELKSVNLMHMSRIAFVNFIKSTDAQRAFVACADQKIIIDDVVCNVALSNRPVPPPPPKNKKQAKPSVDIVDPLMPPPPPTVV